ncbi:MAG: hypothetical protein V3U46_07305 [Acidimicrobiia bacterium]
MADAVRIVNTNIAEVTGTLRASGPVDGYLTLSDGRRRSYHLDGVLFYLAPTYFRFDLKKLGDRQLLFGSNEEHYWFYSKEEDEYYCGRHGVQEDLPPEMPIRPDRIHHALGLTPIAEGEEIIGRTRLIQRVVDDYQQILLLTNDDAGNTLVEKEYWLDRYAPRLVRRVVFRDADGVVEMESRLNNYRALERNGLWLPHVMVAHWPKEQMFMRLRVGKWKIVDQVGPHGPQFATPMECIR